MCVCGGGGGGALGQKCYCTRAECIVSTLKCFLTQRSVDRYLKALQIVFSASTLFSHNRRERENASFFEGNFTNGEDQGRSFITLFFLLCPLCCYCHSFCLCNQRPRPLTAISPLCEASSLNFGALSLTLNELHRQLPLSAIDWVTFSH